jgi:translation initiation factor 1
MARDENSRLVYSTEGKQKEPPQKDKSPPKRGRGVKVHLERRASGRTVTVVSGLSGGDIPGLVRRLKAACAAGGTLKGDLVELQGDHRELVLAFLDGLKK